MGGGDVSRHWGDKAGDALNSLQGLAKVIAKPQIRLGCPFVLSAAKTPPHLGTIILLVAISVLTLNMFLPALPAMAEDFEVSKAVMGLAVSGYMVVAGLLQLVLGPISDRIGRRAVLLWIMGLFVIASVGCVLAPNITVFLICRFAQGAIIGASVVAAAAIRDMYPPAQAAGKMGTVAAAMAIAPMLGPALGGVLDTVLSWEAIFVAYSLLGAFSLALIWGDFGETLNTPPRSVADQARAYTELLRMAPFWAYSLCTGFSVGAFYIFLAGAPFVALQVFGLSSAVIGAGLGSITGGYMAGSFATSRLSPRLGTGPMILAGRTITMVGLCTGALLFALGFSHPLILFGATICVGIGNGLTIANTNTGTMSVRPDLAGSAIGLSGAMQLLGGAVLASVTLWWLEGAVTPLRLLSLMIATSAVALVLGVWAVRGQKRLDAAAAQ